MNEPVKLVPTMPDKELAAELKKELIETSKPWLDACTKAHAAGFMVSSQFGVDFTGKYVIMSLNLVKHF